MLTRENLLEVFILLELSGIRRPDDLADPDPERSMKLLEASADSYALVLADVAPEDLKAAVVGRLRQPSPYWPTPGQILAMLPARRLESIDDAESAWAATKAWCRKRGRERGSCGYREPEEGELDPEASARDEAMREALRCVGGVGQYMRSETKDEPWIGKRFCDAYRNYRARCAAAKDNARVLELTDRQVGGAIRRLFTGGS